MIEACVACAAVLLVVSGVAKLRRPGPAAAMLRSLGGLPGRRVLPASVARVAGAVETAIGLCVLAFGGRVAGAALAATYLVLALVAWRLLVTGRRAGRRVACGCFGSPDAPIGPAHLVLDAAGVLAGVAAAVHGTAAVAGLGDRTASLAVVAGLQIALLSWLVYLAVTELPALAARRRALTGSSNGVRS